jgi:hypothetical protein
MEADLDERGPIPKVEESRAAFERPIGYTKVIDLRRSRDWWE